MKFCDQIRNLHPKYYQKHYFMLFLGFFERICRSNENDKNWKIETFKAWGNKYMRFRFNFFLQIRDQQTEYYRKTHMLYFLFHIFTETDLSINSIDR
jgi:hypothetical protein